MGQSKMSGSIDCGRADPMYQIAVPDREGVAFVMGQTKCTYLKSSPVGGLQPRDFVNTNSLEVSG